MKILSKSELPLWLNCNQMDIKVVISIKYGWNTIVLRKIRHLRHLVQNLLAVKVHTTCKISEFCWHFKATKTHMERKIFGIWHFFYLKRQSYRCYQEKNQVGLTSSSYIYIKMKLWIKSKNNPKNMAKMKFYIFGEVVSQFWFR